MSKVDVDTMLVDTTIVNSHDINNNNFTNIELENQNHNNININKNNNVKEEQIENSQFNGLFKYGNITSLALMDKQGKIYYEKNFAIELDQILSMKQLFKMKKITQITGRPLKVGNTTYYVVASTADSILFTTRFDGLRYARNNDRDQSFTELFSDCMSSLKSIKDSVTSLSKSFTGGSSATADILSTPSSSLLSDEHASCEEHSMTVMGSPTTSTVSNSSGSSTKNIEGESLIKEKVGCMSIERCKNTYVIGINNSIGDHRPNTHYRKIMESFELVGHFAEDIRLSHDFHGCLRFDNDEEHEDAQLD